MKKLLFASLIVVVATSLFGPGASLGLSHAQEPAAAADSPIAGGLPDRRRSTSRRRSIKIPGPCPMVSSLRLGDPWRAPQQGRLGPRAGSARRPGMEGSHHAALV